MTALQQIFASMHEELSSLEDKIPGWASEITSCLDALAKEPTGYELSDNAFEDMHDIHRTLAAASIKIRGLVEILESLDRDVE